MMLLDLSRHTVRRNCAPYVGSFVALFLGVTLIGLTVEMITRRQPRPRRGSSRATRRPACSSMTWPRCSG